MADLAQSTRRVLAAYGLGTADRIPIASPISWDPLNDIDEKKPGGWRADPGFVEIARLVQEHCDVRPPRSAGIRRPDVFGGVSYMRFCLAPAEFREQLPDQQIGPTRRRRTTVLHTPKGDLTWAYDEDEGIETQWDRVKPIQSPDDVEKMLSVPCPFVPPDPSEFEAFRAHRAEAGRETLAGAGLCSMVAMLVGMMPYQQVLEWIAMEPGLIRRLADAWLDRTRERVAYLLDQGVGPFWHFNGIERACPPMMGPRQWAELIVPYDGEIMRLIKERDPEAFIHVHCHGRVKDFLPLFERLGVDSTDPVEPPPQGDVTFAEARRIVGDRMTLYGNIEFADMEMCEPDEIEAKVRRAIDEGGAERTFLYTSAGPHERHTARFNANAIRYIEAGLKYGGR